MTPMIEIAVRLTKALAETHNNPIPLFKLYNAIVATGEFPLVMEIHNFVKETMIDAVITLGNSGLLDQPLEPYDLDETTLMDQIIADLGETK
jgi:hypothetical protein